jgi:transcriptional antiterminator RfaH
MNRWYVVHARPRAERTALTNLLRQGFSAFLPEYLKQRRHARRTDIVRAPLFPRYLFVAMDVAQARWRDISSTLGVSHIICHGNAPVPVPQGVVESIKDRLDDAGLVPEPRPSFNRGDAVQVTSGAFADQIGFFECVTDEARIILLLQILGRQVRVQLPVGIVAPAV